MDPGRYAAGIAARPTKRAGSAAFGFQEAQRAGTIIRHPSTNRWAMVAAALTGPTGTTEKPPRKDRPRTRPSPRLWTPTNATEAQTIRLGTSLMNGPSRRSHAIPAPVRRPSKETAVAAQAS